VAATVCVLAVVAGVVGIGANIKALDKVSEVQSRLQSGQALLDGSSTALTSLQKQGNSSSGTLGLLSTVLSALNGGGGADKPLASLVRGADLSSELPDIYRKLEGGVEDIDYIRSLGGGRGGVTKRERFSVGYVA